MRPTGQDPHRTLGVAPGAGEAEIKRAFRALAKRYHPDARDGSAARFIEIQAAYEALLGTAAPGTAGSGGATPGTSPAPRSGRRPAQAGATRASGAGAGAGGPAGSTGSAWARRPGQGSAGGPGTRASGETGAPGGRDQSSAAGGSPTSGGSRTGGAGDSRRKGGTRRATLGSTTYDEAEEVFEPDWGGATWYGASSGTYWTVNPKEYADPRKHGPEYQARARRQAAGAEAAGAEGAGTAGPAAEAGGAPPRSDNPEPPAAGPGAAGESAAPAGGSGGSSSRARRPGDGTRNGRSTPGDLPPEWRAQPWTAAGPPDAARPTFEHETEPLAAPASPAARGSSWPPGARTAGAPGAIPGSAPTPLGPVAIPADAPGVAARVVLAVAGWAVPGLALAAIAGLPGVLTATLPLQAAGVVLLALVPRLAWAAAGGGLAVVFAAIPIVALVAALGGPVAPGEPMPIAAVLAALAWAGGVLAVGSGRIAPFPWRTGG